MSGKAVHVDPKVVMKRSRIKYTREQVRRLERLFEETRYPDSETQEKFALEMGVTVERISIWFQNRRSKFKRQRQPDHVSWMRKQIFTSGGEKSHSHPSGQPQLPLLAPDCNLLSPMTSQLNPRGDCVWSPQQLSPFEPVPSPLRRIDTCVTPQRHGTSNDVRHFRIDNLTGSCSFVTPGTRTAANVMNDSYVRTPFSSIPCNTQSTTSRPFLTNHDDKNVTSQSTRDLMHQSDLTSCDDDLMFKPNMAQIEDFFFDNEAAVSVSLNQSVSNDSFLDDKVQNTYLPLIDIDSTQQVHHNYGLNSVYQW